MAKQSIRRLLIKLIAAELFFVVTVGLLYYILILNLGISQRFFYPANYGETISRQVINDFKAGKVDLAAVPDIVEYALLDNENKIIQSTIEKSATLEKILENPEKYRTGGYQGRVVEQDNQKLIVMYRLRSEFQNPLLRHYLPPAEPFILVLSILAFISGFLMILSHFAKVISRELAVVVEVNDSILAEDMTHERKESSLKEVQEILTSLYKLEDALKESLQKEWRQKKQTEDNLRALTHDIKTPVALVSGNLELLSETTVSEEQQLYLDYAQKGITRIDNYVSELRELSDPISKENALVPFNQELISELLDIVAQHGIIKNVSVNVSHRDSCPQLKIDKLEFLKAFQNIIENGIRYTPANSELKLAFRKSELNYQIEVTDEGPGFSEVALDQGKEQFFTENKGREANHIGMGLAIATKVIAQQGGELTLANDIQVGKIHGARVTINWQLN